jgi:hypothetical protein
LYTFTELNITIPRHLTKCHVVIMLSPQVIIVEVVIIEVVPSRRPSCCVGHLAHHPFVLSQLYHCSKPYRRSESSLQFFYRSSHGSRIIAPNRCCNSFIGAAVAAVTSSVAKCCEERHAAMSNDQSRRSFNWYTSVQLDVRRSM